jgi:YggT family protein
MEDTVDNILRAVGIVTIALLNILETAMFLRAILSWFVDGSNKLYSVLASITEPIILPIRKLLSKTSIGGGMPIDISFLVTYLLLEVVRTILGVYFR